jgi:hypothetical protein
MCPPAQSMRQERSLPTARRVAWPWQHGDCCAAIPLPAEDLTRFLPRLWQELFPTNHYHRTSAGLTAVRSERLSAGP